MTLFSSSRPLKIVPMTSGAGRIVGDGGALRVGSAFGTYGQGVCVGKWNVGVNINQRRISCDREPVLYRVRIDCLSHSFQLRDADIGLRIEGCPDEMLGAHSRNGKQAVGVRRLHP